MSGVCDHSYLTDFCPYCEIKRLRARIKTLEGVVAEDNLQILELEEALAAQEQDLRQPSPLQVRDDAYNSDTTAPGNPAAQEQDR